MGIKGNLIFIKKENSKREKQKKNYIRVKPIFMASARRTGIHQKNMLEGLEDYQEVIIISDHN